MGHDVQPSHGGSIAAWVSERHSQPHLTGSGMKPLFPNSPGNFPLNTTGNTIFPYLESGLYWGGVASGAPLTQGTGGLPRLEELSQASKGFQAGGGNQSRAKELQFLEAGAGRVC